MYYIFNGFTISSIKSIVSIICAQDNEKCPKYKSNTKKWHTIIDIYNHNWIYSIGKTFSMPFALGLGLSKNQVVQKLNWLEPVSFRSGWPKCGTTYLSRKVSFNGGVSLIRMILFLS